MIDGILIAIFGFSTMFAALSMPLALEFEGAQAFMIGPGFLPAIFGGVLGVLGLIRGVCAYKKRSGGASIQSSVLVKNRQKIVRYLVLTVIFTVFVFSIGTLPFRVITFGYFAVFYIFMYFDDIKRIGTAGKIACLSIGSTLFLAYLLPAMLQIPLP